MGDRLTDRLGIRGIVAPSPLPHLHILRRHQPHIMAKRDQLAPPLVGARAGLHADEAARQPGKEAQQLRPAQPPPQHHLPPPSNPENLKHPPRQIDAPSPPPHPPYPPPHPHHQNSRPHR